MAELERITELELIPVVELLPWIISDRPLPEGLSPRHTDAWLRHWLDCLADAGITGLLPIAPGSMHVAVSGFTDLTALAQVVQRVVGAETLTAPDGPGAFTGGFAVVAGGRVLVEPNCCCDLKDWHEWQSAALYRDLAWRILWIGHPWLSVRSEGENLILTTPHESAEPVPKWVLDRHLIAPALADVTTELECFAQRLAQSLSATAPDISDVVRVARTLAGLPFEEDDADD